MGGSEFVPDALTKLVDAQTEEEATEAYWRLDNRVVVQGELFEAAELIIGPLMACLCRSLSSPARRWIVALLLQIALGVPGEEELRRGNVGLEERIRAELRAGIWVLYSLLDVDDAAVSVDALEILDEVETDRLRLRRVLERVCSVDSRVLVVEEARRTLAAQET